MSANLKKKRRTFFSSSFLANKSRMPESVSLHYLLDSPFLLQNLRSQELHHQHSRVRFPQLSMESCFAPPANSLIMFKCPSQLGPATCVHNWATPTSSLGAETSSIPGMKCGSTLGATEMDSLGVAV